jgi:hypothetical protein
MNLSRLSTLLLVAFGLTAAGSSIGQTPQQSVPTIVMGNNPNWTRIAGVNQGWIIRVGANGAVKFGPRSSTDTAEAGVEGSSFLKWTQGVVPSSDWSGFLKNPHNYPDILKSLGGNRGPVNFNQGGVWIKITDPAGQEIVPANLWYYYSVKGGFNDDGLNLGQDVIVWAKAHDGGRDPESRDSYNDNTGAYHVWVQIAPAPKIPGTF